MSKELNIVVCGLTGQGLVMLTGILSQALMQGGHEVLTTDIPPITHRYSSSISHLRVGENIYSPTIPEGEADLVIAFEPLEALKAGLMFVSENGMVIMNERAIAQTRVFSGSLMQPREFKYPTTEEILAYFKRAKIKDVIHFDASDVAVKEAGTLLSLNIVMLGAAIGTNMIPVNPETIEDAIEANVPTGTAEANLKAFRAGMKAVEGFLVKKA